MKTGPKRYRAAMEGCSNGTGSFKARVQEIQDFSLVNTKATKRQINSISEAGFGTCLDKRMAAEKGDWTKECGFALAKGTHTLLRR